MDHELRIRVIQLLAGLLVHYCQNEPRRINRMPCISADITFGMIMSSLTLHLWLHMLTGTWDQLHALKIEELTGDLMTLPNVNAWLGS